MIHKLFRNKFRFSDPELEREYVIFNNQKAAKQASIGFATGAFGYAVLGVLFYLLRYDYFLNIWWFIYLVIVPTHLLAAYFVSKLGRLYLLQWVLSLANLFSGYCSIFILWMGSPEFVSRYGYGLLLAINLYSYFLLRLRLKFATGTTVLVIFSYFVILQYRFGFDLDQVIMTLSLTMFINFTGLIGAYFFEVFSRGEFLQQREIEKQSAEIAKEKKRSEELLLNILPQKVANRLLSGETSIADFHANVTVLFADIEGFTGLSRRMQPAQVVTMLNTIFSQFDSLAQKWGLEKIKTIGDAYMVAAGLPDEMHDHAERCLAMAVDMLKIITETNNTLEEPLRLRVGIATGPVVAGVIGRNKFIYDLWGDTVNTASRMESSGVAGEIHITETTMTHSSARYSFRDRGEIEIKGMGKMRTYLVEL